MYTIKWTGLEPTEAGSSPPSDTKQPHAERCRDLLTFFAAVIAKMHARRAVHELAFSGVGRSQQGGESTDSFEEFVHQCPDSSPDSDERNASITAVADASCPLGESGALGNEGRVHSGLQGVEVLTSFFRASRAWSLARRSSGGSLDSWLSAARMAVTVLSSRSGDVRSASQASTAGRIRSSARKRDRGWLSSPGYSFR